MNININIRMIMNINISHDIEIKNLYENLKICNIYI